MSATTTLADLTRSRSAASLALARWAGRLFRREWRQQLLVLALIAVAVATTTVGIALAASATASQAADFGAARQMITLDPSNPRLADDVSAARAAFGAAEAIAHAKLSVPGALDALDVRDQQPGGPLAASLLRLDVGRYPVTTGEAALTSGAAALLGTKVGARIDIGGRTRTVVGLVENPRRLSEDFALVTPGTIEHPDRVDLLVRASGDALRRFRLPDGSGLAISSRSIVAASQAAAVTLAIASVGMLFVGLLCVAGFAVMAQRRRRALGMLGALGATDRQVRQVLLIGGGITGLAGAVVGVAVGVGAWATMAGRLEGVVDHRIDRFDVPWWAVGAAVVLAVVTAVAAAWWPARAASRTSVVAALSGRPPALRSTHRSTAVGLVLLAVGATLLFVSRQRTGWAIAGGSVSTMLGVLFLAPAAVRAAAVLGRHAPISARIAIRDLVRFRSRSGAAVGAAALAVGIAATISISARASVADQEASGVLGNLPVNEVVVYAGQPGGGPTPILNDEALTRARTAVAAITTAIGATTSAELDTPVDPAAPTVSLGGVTGVPPTALVVSEHQNGAVIGYRWAATLYAATPDALAFAGIDANAVEAGTDVVTARRDLAGTEIVTPRRSSTAGTERAPATTPMFQLVDRPVYTSEPTTLMTTGAIERLGLEARPVAWALRSSGALTTAQLTEARRTAATAGLFVESHRPNRTYGRLRFYATALGLLVAVSVLAMTVGLIRAESIAELRTLAATGATGRTRRAVVGVTAAVLGLLGGLLGVLGAYVALLAWHRNRLTPLTSVPVVDLLALVVLLPLVAGLGGTLLAGREPESMARTPIE